MSERNKQKQSSYNLLLRESTPQNPLAPTTGSRQVRNFIPRKGGYLERKTAAQLFLSSDPAIVAQEVWQIIDFKYQDKDGGDHQELLWVKDDGRIYRKHRGGEEEIYPRFTLRPQSFTELDATVSSSTNAMDDKKDTKATLTATGGADAAAEGRWFNFQTTHRNLTQATSLASPLAVSIRSEVIGTLGGLGAARTRYSLDSGTTFTNIYNPTTSTDLDRALQNDGVGITDPNQDISTIFVEARVTKATSGTQTIDLYDVWLDCIWDGARVLTNPRDVAWVVANNKLFISDGDQSLVYLGQRNGGGWYTWGMPRPAIPSVERFGASTLTLSTGRKYAVSWTHIEDGIRIHESSRSDIVEGGAITNQKYRILRPVAPPERATHWTIYGSRVNGAVALVRLADVPIDDVSYTDESPDFGRAGSLFSSVDAPFRNDPPPRSKLLEIHKGRIFARNEDEKNELWFSALGEVAAHSNGSPQESFPGFATNSLSGLTQNFFDLPDQTSELSSGKSWANVFWFFNKREGFVLTGEGGLLDSVAIRDFFPSPAFRVGCAGPKAITTTPFGLAWMSPEHNLWLFAGSRGGADLTASLIDIGYEKQKLLNKIDDRELERMQMLYFAPMNSLVCRFTTFDLVKHLLFYSFDIQNVETGIPGGWFEFTDVDATAIGTFFDRNKEFLLVGEADGEIRVIEQIAGNSVIGKTNALIGKIVLGASSNISNYPAATLRTANSNLGYDGVKDAKKVYAYPYRQSVADDDVSTQAAPTVAFWDDVLDPDTPGSSTSVTLSTATKTRQFRGHIGAAGGTLCDRVMLEVAFATGVPEGTADGDDFLECFTSRLCGLGITFIPKEEQFPNP